MAYAGIFTLKGLPEQFLAPMLYIECPRMLFPFVRQLIAEITGNGGITPLMLNPVDFAALFRQQQEKMQQQQQAGQAGNA